MFQKAELERLRAQKALLVLQSDAHRLLLAADWQRVRSLENWRNAAGSLVSRHPAWTAALAAAAGALAVKAVRQPGSVMGGMRGLGKLTSVAFSVWKLMRPGKAEE